VRVKVSENLVLFWKGGRLICDNFVTHEQHALSQSAEPLLRWFSDWRDVSSADEISPNGSSNAVSSSMVREMIDAGILIEEGSEAHQLESKLEDWDTFRRATRYFHCSVRTLEDTHFLPLAEDARRLLKKAQRHPAPPLYKEHPDARRVPLPEPVRIDDGSKAHDDDFLRVLLRRRTSRDFDPGRPVALEQLASLLYYVAGATHVGHSVGTGDVLLKTSPSAGARHSIEVYPCILNVQGVAAGFYHYSVRTHELELLAETEPHERVPALCGDQDWTGQAGAIFFYTAIMERPRWKYPSPRVYRDVCIDLGHLSQTFYLVSAWLGLGAFFTGALREEPVEKELGVDWTEEIVLGASGVGVALSEARAVGRLRAHP